MNKLSINLTEAQLRKIKYHAALLTIKQLHADEIKLLVNELIDQSIFIYEFIPILDSNPPTLSELEKPFIDTLNGFGIAMPDIEQSTWIIIEHYMKIILDENVDPIEVFGECKNKISYYDLHKHTQNFLGDSHKLETMIGLYYSYEDMLELPTVISYDGKYENEGITQLKKDMKDAACKWLNDNTVQSMLVK